MIVVDIETSGLYPERHGIWQIGALDYYNPENTFVEDGRIDEEDEITEGALKVTGKTEEALRDLNKQSQRSLMQSFFNWTKTVKIKNAICQNPVFDIAFINYKARKLNVTNDFFHLDSHTPFHYRSFDLHSEAQLKYHQIHRGFLFKESHSNMGLTNILEFCGIEDKRKEHNALEDAKLTAECFARIIDGKALFPEYSQFKIPIYLAK